MNSDEKKENSTSITAEELKPRKWILYILILISTIIVFYLSYSLVISLKQSHDKEKAKWDNFESEFNNIDEKIDKESFNYNFEEYEGTETKISVGWLLDEVTTNNKKNKNRLITVIYGNKETSDPQEIKNIKKELTKSKYEISIDYDNKGFVNKITIEDIE